MHQLNANCETASKLLKPAIPVEILLAEDNDGDARLIKEIVSHCSVAVRITMAKDGEKALALLADPQFKPDLVITDMNMPKVAGPELLKQFNANGIPVVVFSSSTNPTDKEEVLKLGARECVEKPSDLDEYTEALWKDDLEVDATSDLVLLPTPSKRTDFRPFWVGWRTIAAT